MVFIPALRSEGADWCCPELAGSKLITLGGGNAAGQFTVDALKAIQSDLHLIPEANYSGVVFDVEEAVGNGEDLKEAFEETFLATKKMGLEVIITTSHSAPYQTDDASIAVDLVKVSLQSVCP